MSGVLGAAKAVAPTGVGVICAWVTRATSAEALVQAANATTDATRRE
jgi:hypothetical protein